MASTLRSKIKQLFPGVTRALADRYRWHLRMRNDFGAELRYHTALPLADLRPESRVLEVGHLTYKVLEMSKRVSSIVVCNITGINRAVAAHGPANVEQVVGDICTYPFPDASMDVCLAIAVLEHVEDDLAAAKNILRCLRPGGCFVAYVPDTDEHLAAWERGEYSDHVRPGYTREQMRDLLQRAGFEVAYCELVNGIYAAMAGKLYYAMMRRAPFLRQLPLFFARPFLRLATVDEQKPGSLRWGLYCKAVKPATDA